MEHTHKDNTLTCKGCFIKVRRLGYLDRIKRKTFSLIKHVIINLAK